jgi:hypothetical protein
MPEQQVGREKKDDSLNFKCYSDEKKRWRRLFETRDLTLANAVRGILNNAADKKEAKP